jgi:hypothetical protein
MGEKAKDIHGKFGMSVPVWFEQVSWVSLAEIEGNRQGMVIRITMPSVFE